MAIAFGKQFGEELMDWEAKCDWVDGECSVICIMYVELCVCVCVCILDMNQEKVLVFN